MQAYNDTLDAAQPTVTQAPENTTVVVVVFIVDCDDDDDASQFDVSATHFQHLLLTNIGSCSTTELVWIACYNHINAVTEVSFAAF